MALELTSASGLAFVAWVVVVGVLLSSSSGSWISAGVGGFFKMIFKLVSFLLVQSIDGLSGVFSHFMGWPFHLIFVLTFFDFCMIV